MKEFHAESGGRYTYSDDILNLQDLALAFNSVFADCGNFIVSGCEIGDTAISSGYVFINNKLRYFGGINNISQFPVYIYEHNTTELVDYVGASAKVGRKVYGCACGASVPVENDPLTGKVPQSITVKRSGAPRLKDSFIGRYALLLGGGAQTIDDRVTFSDGIVVSKDGCSAKISAASDSVTISVSKGNDVSELVIKPGNAFEFWCEGIRKGEFKLSDSGGYLSGDTGWIDITNTLHVRQINDIVSVQGTIISAGFNNDTSLFELPDSISAPRYDVFYQGGANGVIRAGSRTFVSTQVATDGINQFPISFTYMV